MTSPHPPSSLSLIKPFDGNNRNIVSPLSLHTVEEKHDDEGVEDNDENNDEKYTKDYDRVKKEKRFHRKSRKEQKSFLKKVVKHSNKKKRIKGEGTGGWSEATAKVRSGHRIFT